MVRKKKAPETHLIQGDCIEKLQQLQVAPHLFVPDPPYNIGQKYDTHQDKLLPGQYLDWTKRWLQAVRLAIHRHGSMWVFINDLFVSEVDVLAKSLGFKKRSHVVWHYTFGQNTRGNFTPSHTHLLYYSVTKGKYTWNGDDKRVRYPSARQTIYKDKRANPAGRLPDNTWVLRPEQLPEAFDPAGDTWLASRVCGTFHERKPHSPNQLPIPLLERIILLCSNPGDLVCDPFLGSGTAGVAARMHGRNFVGFDVSRSCVINSQERILAVDHG